MRATYCKLGGKGGSLSNHTRALCINCERGKRNSFFEMSRMRGLKLV